MNPRQIRFTCRALALALTFSAAVPAFAESYVIRDEVYEISGRTSESTIASILEDGKNKTFASKESLEAFAKAQTQKLENLRVFKKSEVVIVYSDIHSGIEPAGALPDEIPVTLKILIEDGAPVSPIPYAFYNSNDGFQSGLLLSMPNIAGSMQNLMLVGLYTAPPDENDDLRWTNPNFMFMTAWNGIRLGPFKLALSGSVMKMKNDVEDRGVTGLTYDEFRFAGSTALTLPFTEHVSETLSVRAAGSPDSSIVSVSDDDLLVYGPQTYSVKCNDMISYENINWSGNFRDGNRASASIGITSADPRYAEQYTDLTGDAEFAGYRTLSDRFNASFRISGFAKTGKSELMAGRSARGIRNSCMKGTSGFFVNSGMQTKLFRFGSAELHLTPSLDYAFAYASDADDYKTDCGFGAGSELMLIFDSMKTLPIKLGMAYDLRPSNRVRNSNRLEVDFSFSFSY